MICFAWREFPQYAARCVAALVKVSSERVVVVATRPRVPITGMEELAGCPVVWVEEDDSRSLATLVGELPRVLIVSGWGTGLFNRYRDEVHAGGGHVIAMSDNNFIFGLRQVVKAIRFRLLFRKQYEGYLVAGRSCASLLRFYGVSNELIRLGMYSADATIFNDGGVDICSRTKKMLFVGQFIERKNPIRLCEAFALAKGYEKGWTLDLYGSGPLRDQIPTGRGVSVHDFLQPEQLAGCYREARIFVLPSLEEHWGLVVHEAALSGCALLLSDCIGAAADFLNDENGAVFDPLDVRSMAKAMEQLMALNDTDLRRAQRESIRLGRKIGTELFAQSISEFAAPDWGAKGRERMT